MWSTKAPGPNGYHVIFYYNFWEIVGPYVIRACLGVLNEGCSVAIVNGTNLVLIPKKKDLVGVAAYRPSSLFNVVYKLVTKTIANRLKLVLPNRISHFQSTFVLDRLITDNVILAF